MIMSLVDAIYLIVAGTAIFSVLFRPLATWFVVGIVADVMAFIGAHKGATYITC